MHILRNSTYQNPARPLARIRCQDNLAPAVVVLTFMKTSLDTDILRHGDDYTQNIKSLFTPSAKVRRTAWELDSLCPMPPSPLRPESG